MSRRSQSKIRIVNPMPNGSPFTSHRRAADYVQRGRARWTELNRAIEFLSETQIRLTRTLQEQNARREYDPVTDSFRWYVGVSDGETLVKAAH